MWYGGWSSAYREVALAALVLLSGGMDSVTALYWALINRECVTGLSFDYGSKHNHREIPFAQWHCRRAGIAHRTIKIGLDQWFESHLLKSGGDIPEGHYEHGTMKKTVVPFRNGIMLAVAAGYAESIGARELVIAAHSGDHAIYPDCREPFMEAMSRAITLGTYAQLHVLRPFIDFDKAAIAKLGVALGIDYAKTWSCYCGDQHHCGRCGTCVERREAFLRAGIPDPTIYLDQAPLPSKP